MQQSSSKTSQKLNNAFPPEKMSLLEWQRRLRVQQSEKESYFISDLKGGEYLVSNYETRNKYKVVYRGPSSQWNSCTCYDFRTSRLGTCKHIEAVRSWIIKNGLPVHSQLPAYTFVYVDYKEDRTVKIRIGEDFQDSFSKLAAKYFTKQNILRSGAITRFNAFLKSAKTLDPNFRCDPDALDIIIEHRDRQQRSSLVTSKYTDEALDNLLTVSLYPYQREGVRFAVNAGKSIIADEMGLGKTIQAIASAEIFLNEGLATSVLVVCPTSLKYQWKREIERFTKSEKEVLVIEGVQPKRAKLYQADAPYKIVSYHAACNDVKVLGKLTTDVLIMDEIQRLKNWDTQISRAARKIESHYSVLLSGTPLENKLEELYANMELVDQFCLGPYYLFRNNHILLNSKGVVSGYRNLNKIGEQISGRLIRRTKKSVMLQLPKRTDQTLLVPMTSQQSDIHAGCMNDLSMILKKYEKFHFMTENDRRRMMLLLSQMRMVSDSTFILDQDLDNRHDVKIDEVMNLLESVLSNGDEKVVIFSEWERMTRLVALEMEKKGIHFEYFNGSLTSKKRGESVERFRTDPDIKVFLSTDAGSTGLNLQVANTLINMDLPWNPAVLEQRVARIYRLGQENPVQIVNLVSAHSFEEGLIRKLRFKSSMAEGVLDGGEDTIFVNDNKFQAFVAEVSAALQDVTADTVSEEPEQKTEEAPVSQTPIQAVEEVHNTATEESSDDAKAPLRDTQKESAEPSSKSKAESDHPVNTDNPALNLVNQGISFLSGLAQTLQSPESTRQFVDSLVETDAQTGQSSIRIPVSSKDTVQQLFSLFQKLLVK